MPPNTLSTLVYYTAYRGGLSRKSFETRKLFSYSASKSAVSPCAVVYCRKNRLGRNRTGYTLSKKLGTAVVRNRARRLVSETFRLCKEAILPCRILVIPRRAIFGAKQQEVQAHLLRTLKKAGLIRENRTADTPSANS